MLHSAYASLQVVAILNGCADPLMLALASFCEPFRRVVDFAGKAWLAAQLMDYWDAFRKLSG